MLLLELIASNGNLRVHNAINFNAKMNVVCQCRLPLLAGKIRVGKELLHSVHVHNGLSGPTLEQRSAFARSLARSITVSRNPFFFLQTFANFIVGLEKEVVCLTIHAPPN
jgi:hypothetical protein